MVMQAMHVPHETGKYLHVIAPLGDYLMPCACARSFHACPKGSMQAMHVPHEPAHPVASTTLLDARACCMSVQGDLLSAHKKSCMPRMSKMQQAKCLMTH